MPKNKFVQQMQIQQKIDTIAICKIIYYFSTNIRFINLWFVELSKNVILFIQLISIFNEKYQYFD